ncbi:MAG: ABC transporter ATP-binding protein [Dehalococcoidales bacterium]|jgi:branched-chain amino acid transport system ATP-binding protein|nr:ABC transporter ATP-binding protein [Dehalococcoidales bacterium]
MVILEAKRLSKHFGGLRAVDKVDIGIDQGDIYGLIGPNGSGKTTFFNLVTGFLPPTTGQVLYKGEVISKLKPHQISQRGIARTFQQNSLFPHLTIKENIIAGRHLKTSGSIAGSFFNTISYKEEQKGLEQKAMELLTFIGLEERADVLAKNLPHGEQRILEIAITLAEEPQLILLDEPATGMNAIETAKVINLIQSIREMGTSVIIVEHHMQVIMGMCNRIGVLSSGVKIAEGTPEDVSKNKEVIAAYLGSGWKHA